MEKNIKMSFPVVGMSCASCAARVDKTLNRVEGVIQADVNYASAVAHVVFDPQKCSPEDLRKAVRDAGYDLLVMPGKGIGPAEGDAAAGAEEAGCTEADGEERLYEEAERIHEKHYRELKRKTVAAIVLAVPLMVLGMLFMDVPWMKYILFALSTPLVYWLGRGFFTSEWKQLRHGIANMDTLVA